jgi:transcriptional regulator with XRE-family HTH domain
MQGLSLVTLGWMPKRAKARYNQASPLVEFGGRVRALREARGWSQIELGHRCDRHFTYISSMERAERNATILTIQKLAKALEVDPAVFLTTDEVWLRRVVREARERAT